MTPAGRRPSHRRYPAVERSSVVTSHGHRDSATRFDVSLLVRRPPTHRPTASSAAPSPARQPSGEGTAASLPALHAPAAHLPCAHRGPPRTSAHARRRGAPRVCAALAARRDARGGPARSRRPQTRPAAGLRPLGLLEALRAGAYRDAPPTPRTLDAYLRELCRVSPSRHPRTSRNGRGGLHALKGKTHRLCAPPSSTSSGQHTNSSPQSKAKLDTGEEHLHDREEEQQRSSATTQQDSGHRQVRRRAARPHRPLLSCRRDASPAPGTRVLVHKSRFLSSPPSFFPSLL